MFNDYFNTLFLSLSLSALNRRLEPKQKFIYLNFRLGPEPYRKISILEQNRNSNLYFISISALVYLFTKMGRYNREFYE